MVQIRPVSDLRNRFTEIELAVSSGEPVYLTKNGYGSMVVMSLEKYAEITNNINDIEIKLDEADNLAEQSDIRLKHEDVFAKTRGKINE